MPPPHSNGYTNGNGHDVDHSEDSASEVGVAFTTSGQVGTSAAAFSQQYLEQQQAYQRAMQEHHQERTYSREDSSDAAEGSQSSKPSSHSTTQLAPFAAPQSQIPAQNRVFGLTKDLNGPSTETAHLEQSQRVRARSSQESMSSLADATSPARLTKTHSGLSSSNNGNAGTSSQAAKSGDGPQFSVEVVAPAFDQRGYPVFSGRGARIRGYLRTRAIQGGEVLVTLFAEISQGSPAAVFGGVALMPPETGEGRRVFTVEERIQLHDDMATLRPGAEPTSQDPDDYIYTVPFDLNLPLGVATRFVDGQPTQTAVALPPSYEMSSKNDGKEKESAKAANLLRSSAASIKSKSSRMTNFSTSAVSIGNTVKDAVEKGLGEVYRIGCFYKIGFTLIKPPAAVTEPPKRSRLGKKKKANTMPTVLDKITVPFIFTGEPSNLPPPPHSIPLHLVAPALLNAGHDLGPQWEHESNVTKWSGNFFRTAKRQVQLEMHIPRPAVLQAPCVFPIILIIRPLDPALLASIPSFASFSADSTLDTETIHPYTNSPRSGGSKATSRVPTATTETDSTDTAMDHNRLVQKLKTSMTLKEKEKSEASSRLHTPMDSSSSSIRGSIASTLNKRRPHTAPSGISSSDGASVTSPVGPTGNYTGSLSGLVKVTLLRTTYCISSNPSDPPKNPRKLISEAEIEEVDIETILSEARSNGTTSMEEEQTLIQHVQGKGIRVLRGLIRVGTDAIPSFRCQGIEVKYALKVDLIPFSKKDNKRPHSGSSPTNGSSTPARASISDMPSSPPLPPFPADLRPSSYLASSSASTATRQPNYSPSVALGLGVTGGSSTIVSESAMGGSRLGKGIGALWADVRMVRGAMA